MYPQTGWDSKVRGVRVFLDLGRNCSLYFVCDWYFFVMRACLSKDLKKIQLSSESGIIGREFRCELRCESRKTVLFI